jgi:hypothetical protein
MSTKNIILSLVGVIIIGGAVYFAMSQQSTKMTTTSPVSTSKNEQVQPGVTPEPTKNASNDAIIDYLVDGQSADITAAAEASLQTSIPQEEEPSISTNF